MSSDQKETDLFTFQSVTSRPKRMPRKTICGTIYELRHANGFIKIYTQKGITYIASQVYADNRAPDWKLHISVCSKDEGRAYDLISQLFLSEKYHGVGIMKLKYGEWPEYMRGREFTIYIMQHDPRLKRMDGYDLSKKDELPEKLWFELVREIETNLKKANIRSNNGTNVGDHKLGEYVSIRNEAFCSMPKEWKPPKDSTWAGWDFGRIGKTQFVYPPNEKGWNASKMVCPLDVESWDPKKLRFKTFGPKGRVGRCIPIYGLVGYWSIVLLIVLYLFCAI